MASSVGAQMSDEWQLRSVSSSSSSFSQHPSSKRFLQENEDYGAPKRRFRTNFTESQSLLLEEQFQETHYPDQATKRHIAILLEIPEDRITVWFQNRRAKWRRKENRDKERTQTVQPDSTSMPIVDYPNPSTAKSQTSYSQPDYPRQSLYVNYPPSYNCSSVYSHQT